MKHLITILQSINIDQDINQGKVYAGLVSASQMW